MTKILMALVFGGVLLALLSVALEVDPGFHVGSHQTLAAGAWSYLEFVTGFVALGVAVLLIVYMRAVPEKNVKWMVGLLSAVFVLGAGSWAGRVFVRDYYGQRADSLLSRAVVDAGSASFGAAASMHRTSILDALKKNTAKVTRSRTLPRYSLYEYEVQTKPEVVISMLVDGGRGTLTINERTDLAPKF